MSEKKTVYILGAGFSNAISLMSEIDAKDIDLLKSTGFIPRTIGGINFPITKTLMHDCYISMNHESQQIMRDYFERYWYFKNESDLLSINIEEVMTSLDHYIAQTKMIQLSSKTYDPMLIRNLISKTILAMITDQTQILSLKKEGVASISSKKVNEVLRKTGSLSCIVTFNWDLLVDLALYDEKNKLKEWLGFKAYDSEASFGFMPAAVVSGDSGQIYDIPTPKPIHSEIIPIYKLHGSSNWVYCNHCGRTTIYELVNAPNIVLGKGFGEFFSTCPYDKNPLTIDIIGPSWIKAFERDPYRSIWKAAEMKISEADQIVVIGYSMADADFKAREMFRMATRDNENERRLIIVDSQIMDEKFVSKFIMTFGPKQFEGFDSLKSFLDHEFDG